MKTTVRKSARAAARAARSRLPRGEREGAILEAATELFAEQGFGVSTREIAARLGVTQALLYRYFPSKQALIERVLAARFGGDRWNPELDMLLADRKLPLAERLIRFYEGYRRRSNPTSLKLWVQAGLSGAHVAGRYSGKLTRRVLAPIIRELRHEAGLPEFSKRGFMRGERELAMVLHGGLVFIDIRKHVYRMPMPDNLDDLLALHVRTFIAGALQELHRLHSDAAEPALTVRVAFSALPGDDAAAERSPPAPLRASHRAPTSRK
jgi:AcrR family transcriptional regulator